LSTNLSSMRTLMFVLAGLPGNNSNADLGILHAQLQESLKKKGVSLSFERKKELLLARFEGVAYYCSFLSHKSELKDWFMMAKDFKLKCNKRPLSSDDLQQQYANLWSEYPDMYRPIHFSIAEIIFEEIGRFNDVDIYAFH